MSLIQSINTESVTQLLAKARNEIQGERTAKAVEAFKKQLRTVDAAEQVLRSEQRKLEDLQRQIEDGSL